MDLECECCLKHTQWYWIKGSYCKWNPRALLDGLSTSLKSCIPFNPMRYITLLCGDGDGLILMKALLKLGKLKD